MKKNILGLTETGEKIICESLHNVLDRLIASNKIVLELSRMDIGTTDQEFIDHVLELIIKSRRYVLTQMTSEVGVRKMAREKWGMILSKKEKP